MTRPVDTASGSAGQDEALRQQKPSRTLPHHARRLGPLATAQPQHVGAMLRVVEGRALDVLVERNRHSGGAQLALVDLVCGELDDAKPVTVCDGM